MRKIHELKCWPGSFEPLWTRDKKAELRRNDREYQVNDLLLIQEWGPPGEREYTGRTALARISHIEQGPPGLDLLPPGVVMLSLQILETTAT